MLDSEKAAVSLKEIIISSLVNAGRQYPALLKTISYTVFYMWVEIAIILALLVFGYRLGNALGIFMEIVAVLYVLVLAVKLNGALGLVLTYISAGEAEGAEAAAPREIAWKGLKNSFAFFFNGLRTGVLLMFGQILIICPCFLLLSNFIYSPYLFVYENLKGESAEQRSRELSSGSRWIALNQTFIILLIAYSVLALSIVLLVSLNLKYAGLVALIFMSLYLGLVQSNFIRRIYINALHSNFTKSAAVSAKYKFFTGLSVAALTVLFIGMKLYLKWKS